ncbi:hypothetical protein [Brevundimonas sp. TWP2-3-4b1]|uniref:hypothetical protein n=1 Tax=Brevundimonas sp. TWP2-3-4b1 TaxID=2804580 RepID=UPI003CEDDCA7
MILSRLLPTPLVALALMACSAEPAAGPASAPAATTADSAAPVAAAAAVQASPVTDPAVDRAVQAAEGDGDTLTYVARGIGDGDDRITLVYLFPSHCGNAGCTLLVYGGEGDNLVPLGRTTIVETPIRVLSTSSNGRPDLGVMTGEGEALLAFDGQTYPANPTVAPARIVTDAQGTAMITDADLPPPAE